VGNEGTLRLDLPVQFQQLVAVFGDSEAWIEPPALLLSGHGALFGVHVNISMG
jgi:hypothetical protein